MGKGLSDKSKEKYQLFLDCLAEGETSMTKISEIIGVDRKSLYDWAKKPFFVTDTDNIRRGLRPLRRTLEMSALHRQVITKGDSHAAKFIAQREEGFSEKTETSLTGGVADALTELLKGGKDE